MPARSPSGGRKLVDDIPIGCRQIDFERIATTTR